MQILLLIVAAAILLPAAAVLAQELANWLDRRRLPPPGRLVDVGPLRLHIHEMGSGTPTVVLEAGIAASSVSWAYVQREVAVFTRALCYDRAGYGWSDSVTEPLTPEVLIRQFRQVLAAAGARPPYVIVGHSFGGLLARLYARSLPGEVAGLVLVDPALASEWAAPSPARRAMLDRGIRLSRRGATLARFGIVRLALTLASVGARTLAKFVARASSSSGGERTIERLIGEVRKLPPELLPAVQSHWSRPGAFISMAQHLAMLPAVSAELPARPGELGSLPLVVISGGHLTEEQQAEQAAVAALSSAGRHVIAQGSGHWVHLDQPRLVAAAVREMVDEVRLARR